MPWWYYLVGLFAPLLLVNGLPHFLHGIAGKQFPSPFSGGPGTLDSAVHNVWWGGGNLIVGGVLLWVVRDGLGDVALVVEMIVVGMAFATACGHMFSHPERFGRRH